MPLFTVESYKNHELKEILSFSELTKAELIFGNKLPAKSGQMLRLVQAPRTILRETIGALK